jgi:AraC-like DNA-binding protein
MLKPPITVSMAFVQGMLCGVAARGVSRNDLLVEAGIDPDLLEQIGARVTGEQYIDLFRLVAKSLNDDGLGFFSRPLKRGSLLLMVRSALGAPNLEVGMRRISRTFYLLQDDVEMVQVQEDGLAGWSMVFADPLRKFPEFMHEALLRIFWRVLGWLVVSRLPVDHFDLAFPCPFYADHYGKVLPGPLRFDQPRSAFWFDAKYLKEPIRRDEAQLRSFMLNVQCNVVLPRRIEDEIGGKVRSYLQQHIPLWPDLAATAQALYMSVSTLQRHLGTEGTSFQALKNELRRDMAVSRLNTSNVSLAVLASELGFTDCATFQRAFKSWTGSAPGAYRGRRG